jgi:hypothetical protein
MHYCPSFWIGHFEVSYERDENMEYRHLTFNPLPIRGGEVTRHPPVFALLLSSLQYDAASRRDRRPRFKSQLGSGLCHSKTREFQEKEPDTNHPRSVINWGQQNPNSYQFVRPKHAAKVAPNGVGL